MILVSDLLKKSTLFYRLTKTAGIKEDLIQLGVSEDVITWVLTQTPRMFSVIMPALKANPQASIEDLSKLQFVTKETKNVPYTPEEYQKAETLEASVGKWYLIQCRKLRTNTEDYNILQRYIDTINSSLELFGNNLGNLSFQEAILYLQRVAPIWNNIKYTDPDFRAWAVRQMLGSDNVQKLQQNIISVRDWYAATVIGTRTEDGNYTEGTDIKKYNIDNAVETALEWHRRLPEASDKEVTVYTATKPENIVYAPESWDGWNIQRVVEPQDLKVEGNLMHHCVGGYVDEVAAGTSLIYSLRDPYNKPKVTIELGRSLSVIQVQGYGDSTPAAKYQKLVDEWLAWKDNKLYSDDYDPDTSMSLELNKAREKIIPNSKSKEVLEQQKSVFLSNQIHNPTANYENLYEIIDKCSPEIVREWVLNLIDSSLEFANRLFLRINTPNNIFRFDDERRASGLLKNLNLLFSGINFDRNKKLDSSTLTKMYSLLSSHMSFPEQLVDNIQGKDCLVLVNDNNWSTRQHAAYKDLECAKLLLEDDNEHVVSAAANTYVKNLTKSQSLDLYKNSDAPYIVYECFNRLISEAQDYIDNLKPELKDQKQVLINDLLNFVEEEKQNNHINILFENQLLNPPKSLQSRINDIFAVYKNIESISDEELFTIATYSWDIVGPKVSNEKYHELWDMGLRAEEFVEDLPSRNPTQSQVFELLSEYAKLLSEDAKFYKPWKVKSLLRTDMGKKVTITHGLVLLFANSKFNKYIEDTNWLQNYPISLLPKIKNPYAIAALVQDKGILNQEQIEYIAKVFKKTRNEYLAVALAKQTPQNLLYNLTTIGNKNARKVLYDRINDVETIKRMIHQDQRLTDDNTYIKRPEIDRDELIQYGTAKLKKLLAQIHKEKKKKQKRASIVFWS